MQQPVISLAEKRRQQNQQHRSSRMSSSPERRMQELEILVSKLSEFVYDQGKRIEELEDIQSQLLRRLAASASAGASLGFPD